LAEVRQNLASLAARFAAKEAVSKALGTGIGPVGWHEIEVLRGEARQPVLLLHGEAARLAASLGLDTWSLSLSHTQNYAVAMVVAIGDRGKYEQ
jgi:holo-[acyl-carrier protein] synthase